MPQPISATLAKHLIPSLPSLTKCLNPFLPPWQNIPYHLCHLKQNVSTHFCHPGQNINGISASLKMSQPISATHGITYHSSQPPSTKCLNPFLPTWANIPNHLSHPQQNASTHFCRPGQTIL